MLQGEAITFGLYDNRFLFEAGLYLSEYGTYVANFYDNFLIFIILTMT